MRIACSGFCRDVNCFFSGFTNPELHTTALFISHSCQPRVYDPRGSGHRLFDRRPGKKLVDIGYGSWKTYWTSMTSSGIVTVGDEMAGGEKYNKR